MPVKCRTSSALMQDFLPVRPVDATGDLRALRIDGHPLIFSVGTDDVLYIIYQRDDKPGQGWTRHAILGLPTNAAVTAFGVAQDPNDLARFRVAAALREDENSFLFVAPSVDFNAVNWNSDDDVAKLWSKVEMPGSGSMGSEVRVDRSGKILLATTTPGADARYYLCDPSAPDAFELEDYGLPEAGARIHQMALGSSGGLEGVFLLYDVGSTTRAMLFTSFPNRRFGGRTIKTRFDVDGTVNDFFVLPDEDGNDTLYTCGDRVYAFTDAKSRETIAGDGDVTFNQIRAVNEGEQVTLWLQGTSEVVVGQGLYYMTNQTHVGTSTVITKWSAPKIMALNVLLFACEKQDFISNHLFTVSGDNRLKHLYQDRETTLWRKEHITLKDTAEAEEIRAYVIMAKFLGLDQEEKNIVKISASSTIYGSVNETNVIIGPRKSVVLDLSLDPEVCVSIPLETLTVPDITFEWDMGEGGSLTKRCAEEMIEKLTAFESGKSMREATNTNGERVFSAGEESPSESDFQAVLDTSKGLSEKSKELNKEQTVASRGLLKRLYITGEKGRMKSGEESISYDNVVASRNFFSSTWSAIGDVLHSVAEGFITGVKWAIEVAKESGVLQFVIDLGTEVLNFVIKAVEQVWGAVVTLFNAIGAVIKQIIDLIAFLFNFQDILKCQSMLKDMFNESMDMTRRNIPTIRGKMNKFFDDSKAVLGHEELNDRFESMVGDEALAKQKEESESNVAPESETPQAKMAERKTKAAEKDGAELSSEVGDAVESVFSEFMDVVSELHGNLTYASEELRETFTNLIHGKSSMSNVVMNLMKLVGALILDGVQTITNVTLKLLDKFIEFVRKLVNTKIKIPGISYLANKFLGVKIEFSILDIVTFIPAVFTTVVFKAITGKAPHKAVPRDDWKNLSMEDTESAGMANITSRSASSKSPSGIDKARSGLTLLGAVFLLFRTATATFRMLGTATLPGNVKNAKISYLLLLGIADVVLGMLTGFAGFVVVLLSGGSPLRIAIGVLVILFSIINLWLFDVMRKKERDDPFPRDPMKQFDWKDMSHAKIGFLMALCSTAILGGVIWDSICNGDEYSPPMAVGAVCGGTNLISGILFGILVYIKPGSPPGATSNAPFNPTLTKVLAGLILIRSLSLFSGFIAGLLIAL